MNKIKWKLLLILFHLYFPLQKIYELFLYLKKGNNEIKVFCIGNFKTATNSLNSALRIIGYRSVRIYDVPTYLRYGKKKYAKKIKKSSYEAFVDYPMGDLDLYETIDKEIPGSKFILTVRETESHKKSFYNFYKNFPNPDMIKNLSLKIEKWEKRKKDIINYFKGRESQLLVINIIEGEGWEKLCKFLDKPIPNKPFPRKNVGTYRKRK